MIGLLVIAAILAAPVALGLRKRRQHREAEFRAALESKPPEAWHL